jgi:carboxymethylenebutenolidase
MLYTPPGKGPFPAIIVIHEYWGLNEGVKEQAAKLSDQGHVALAVDLYRGKVADHPEFAHELMRGLPEDRAKRDLHAAFEFLSNAARGEERPHRFHRLVHGRRLFAGRGR